MSLKGYRVRLHDEPRAEFKFTLRFDCLADNKQRAIAQTEKAYPGCNVLDVTPISKVKDRYCIFSPSEDALDSCGFWSNYEGWACVERAATFSAAERLRLTLPLSTGSDAIWCLFNSRVIIQGNPYQI
ncbi:MAG: hypothetical protein M1346_01125 [Gammaproteobacteria bacterium]|nr:hypothetical protein [Gammaproteobacteria bacterium]